MFLNLAYLDRLVGKSSHCVVYVSTYDEPSKTLKNVVFRREFPKELVNQCAEEAKNLITKEFEVK